MNIIPVIDLLDGEVVHAVAGNRASYRPFQDSVFRFDTPAQLVEQLGNAYDPPAIYIADLNAIQQRGDNWQVINDCLSVGRTIWLDAGLKDWNHLAETQSQLIDSNVWVPVFGSESIESIDNVRLAETTRGGKAVFSLDISQGAIRLANNQYLKATTDDLIKLLYKLKSNGFDDLILLSLDAVGTSQLDFESLSGISEQVARLQLRLFVGGGVTDRNDLKELERLGYYGALCASAIHKGWI